MKKDSNVSFFGKIKNFFVPKKDDTANVRKKKMMNSIVAGVAAVAVIGGIVVISVNAIKSPPIDTGKLSSLTESSSEPSSKPSSLPSSEPSSAPSSEASSEISSEASSAASSAKDASSQATATGGKKGGSGMPVSPAQPKIAVNAADVMPAYQDLFKANKELRGYLKVPNTKIDYPVPQSKNNTYYLNKNFYKAGSAWGVPYMDYRVSIGKDAATTSTNIMIYGHGDDARGLQLSGLKNYRDINFYKANPVIEFNTVFEAAKWKVVAFFLEDVNQGSGKTFNFWDFIKSGSDASFNSYINNAKARSYINTTVDVKPSDKLISLQVCRNTKDPNDRLVLVARRVRDGEDASVDTSGATANGDQLFPKRFTHPTCAFSCQQKH